MDDRTEIEQLKENLRALAASHDELAARTMALQTVVEVLAWGTWHAPGELSGRMMESAKESLAAVNAMPERMQLATVDVWNKAMAQLANPDAGSSFIGTRPSPEGS